MVSSLGVGWGISSTQGPHLFSTQNLSVPHQKYLSSTYPSVPHQKPPCSIHQVCVKLRGFAVEPRDFGGKGALLCWTDKVWNLGRPFFRKMKFLNFEVLMIFIEEWEWTWFWTVKTECFEIYRIFGLQLILQLASEPPFLGLLTKSFIKNKKFQRLKNFGLSPELKTFDKNN